VSGVAGVAGHKSVIQFCNINGLRSKRAELRQLVVREPATALIALAEVKVRSGEEMPKLYGYNPHCHEYTERSSGLAVYSAIACRVIKRWKCNHDGNMADRQTDIYAY